MVELETIKWQHRMERWIYIIMSMLFFIAYKVSNDQDWLYASVLVIIFYIIILIIDIIEESKLKKKIS